VPGCGLSHNCPVSAGESNVARGSMRLKREPISMSFVRTRDAIQHRPTQVCRCPPRSPRTTRPRGTDDRGLSRHRSRRGGGPPQASATLRGGPEGFRRLLRPAPFESFVGGDRSAIPRAARWCIPTGDEVGLGVAYRRATRNASDGPSSIANGAPEVVASLLRAAAESRNPEDVAQDNLRRKWQQANLFWWMHH